MTADPGPYVTTGIGEELQSLPSNTKPSQALRGPEVVRTSAPSTPT